MISSSKYRCVGMVFAISTMVLIVFKSANSQPDSLWSHTLGGGSREMGRAIIQTADGGFALAGLTYSFGAGDSDFWLVKTNSDGDSLWSNSFGGRDRDECHSLIQTADGGFVLAGFTFSFGEGDADFWLVRTNSEGDSLWSRTFGGGNYDWCLSMTQTTDEGFILAGTTTSFGAGERDIWVVRTNADGDSLWSRTFGGEDDEECNSIIQTADEGFALAGSTESFGSGFWLVKTNSDGDSIWSNTYEGESAEWCNSLVQTADGGFALAGDTQSYGAGDYDFWLVRTNAQGDSLWSRTFGGGGIEMCNSIIQLAEGGFALAGRTHSFGVYRDFWLVRTNTDGDSLWSRTFSGGSWDDCRSLIQTADGGFALAGQTNFIDINCDFWLVKTGADPVSVNYPLKEELAPSSLLLSTTVPNPFNSTTTISFSVRQASLPVKLAIYDLSGRLVADLSGSTGVSAGQAIHPAAEGRATARSLQWNADGLPGGIYLIRLESGNESRTAKTLLMK